MYSSSFSYYTGKKFFFYAEDHAQGRLYHRATRAAARGPRLKGPQRTTNDEGKISFFLEFFFEKKFSF